MKKRLIKAMLAFLQDAGDVAVDAVKAADVKVVAAASKASFDVASVLAIFEADDRGAVKACLADASKVVPVLPAAFNGQTAQEWCHTAQEAVNNLRALQDDHSALLAWAEAQTPADAEPDPAMTPAVEPEPEPASNVRPIRPEPAAVDDFPERYDAARFAADAAGNDPADPDADNDSEAFEAFCADRPHMSPAVLAYAYKYKAANTPAALEID